MLRYLHQRASTQQSQRGTCTDLSVTGNDCYLKAALPSSSRSSLRWTEQCRRLLCSRLCRSAAATHGRVPNGVTACHPLRVVAALELVWPVADCIRCCIPFSGSIANAPIGAAV